MVVPLWEIGRSRQVLSCKESKINQPRMLGWDRTVLEGWRSDYSGKCPAHLEQRRWPNVAMLNRARHPIGSRRVGREFANRNQQDSACFALILGRFSLAIAISQMP
jgi:hypothetical protein